MHCGILINMPYFDCSVGDTFLILQDYNSAANYRQNMQNALDILKTELPRTMVNVIEVIDISALNEVVSQDFICSIVIP